MKIKKVINGKTVTLDFKETQPIKVLMMKGERGLSSYEEAKENLLFSGTLEEWIETFATPENYITRTEFQKVTQAQYDELKANNQLIPNCFYLIIDDPTYDNLNTRVTQNTTNVNVALNRTYYTNTEGNYNLQSGVNASIEGLRLWGGTDDEENQYELTIHTDGIKIKHIGYGTYDKEYDLFDSIDTINERLDELGFKQGVASYTNRNVTTNSLTKQGKYVIFNFEGTRIDTSIDAPITIPEGFRPKVDTTGFYVYATGTAPYFMKLAENITIRTDGTVTGPIRSDCEIRNLGWEID